MIDIVVLSIGSLKPNIITDDLHMIAFQVAIADDRPSRPEVERPPVHRAGQRILVQRSLMK